MACLAALVQNVIIVYMLLSFGAAT